MLKKSKQGNYDNSPIHEFDAGEKYIIDFSPGNILVMSLVLVHRPPKQLARIFPHQTQSRVEISLATSQINEQTNMGTPPTGDAQNDDCFFGLP